MPRERMSLADAPLEIAPLLEVGAAPDGPPAAAALAPSAAAAAGAPPLSAADASAARALELRVLVASEGSPDYDGSPAGLLTEVALGTAVMTGLVPYSLFRTPFRLPGRRGSKSEGKAKVV